MRKKIDWSKYKFRSSQCHKLLTGDIVDVSVYQERINELKNERDNLVNKNGNKVKWTDAKNKELEKLEKLASTPLFERLPKTMTSFLRELHRAETLQRNFNESNDYTEKGIQQEEEAITIYQYYRNRVLGIRTFFINNKERLENEYITGEADLTDTNDFKKCNEGFDTKCSFELKTFPMKGDKISKEYDIQNQCYMWLTNTKKWTTAKILVNCLESYLFRKKLNLANVMGQTEHGQLNYDRYVEKCKELEKRYIFDYDRFMEDNPMHDIEITREEWFENGYDLDIEDRVVEQESEFNQELVNELKKRIKIARKYLINLDKI